MQNVRILCTNVPLISLCHLPINCMSFTHVSTSRDTDQDNSSQFNSQSKFLELFLQHRPLKASSQTPQSTVEGPTKRIGHDTPTVTGRRNHGHQTQRRSVSTFLLTGGTRTLFEK